MRLLVTLTLLLLAYPAQAQQSYNWQAYCQITALSSVVTLTTANCSTLITASGGTTLPQGAKAAEICVSGASIRYLGAGSTAPTASIGIPVTVGTCFPYTGQIYGIQFIQQSSTATLDIELYQ